MSIKNLSLWEKELKGRYRSAMLIRALFPIINIGFHTRNSLEQVVNADRTLGRFGGFGIDTFVV
jgi:hypothetical protein